MSQPITISFTTPNPSKDKFKASIYLLKLQKPRPAEQPKKKYNKNTRIHDGDKLRCYLCMI